MWMPFMWMSGVVFRGLAVFTTVMALCLPAMDAYAKDESVMRFIRIGTGPTGGTYFPIGA